MSILTLNLKRCYFEEIVAGTKLEEFRLVTPYWRKRLEGRHYDSITLKLGYPSKEDAEKTISRPWRGYTIKTITHPHFGPDPVTVFAIAVNERSENGTH